MEKASQSSSSLSSRGLLQQLFNQARQRVCYNVMGFAHLLVPILCVADHGKNVRQGCGLKEVAHGEACYQVRSRKPSKEWISMSLANGWVWPVKALIEKSVCHMISVVVNEDSV